KRPWRIVVTAHSLPGGEVRIVAVVPAKGSLRAKVGAEPDGPVRAKRLGAARGRALQSGRVALELRLPRRLRHLAHSGEGVYAMARVSFHAKRRKTLRAKVQVRFHAYTPKHGKGKGK